LISAVLREEKSMNNPSLGAEVAAVLRVQEAVRGMKLPPEIASLSMMTFHLVWREALVESDVDDVDDRRRICGMAADAVIAFAQAGLQPEQIRRFARSHLRFVGSSREAAAVM
jgi:hypothetical protein